MGDGMGMNASTTIREVPEIKSTASVPHVNVDSRTCNVDGKRNWKGIPVSQPYPYHTGLNALFDNTLQVSRSAYLREG